jgi:hypothetical protein
MKNFKIGDEVIIDPYAESSRLFSKMRQGGIFQVENFSGGHIYGLSNGYMYDAEWLLPADPFKVGDIVRIRENLKNISHFPHGLVDVMLPFEGKLVTITECLEEYELTLGAGKYYYKVKEDSKYYSWPLCAFDLLTKTEKDESRLQEQESSLSGKSREFSSRVCCRKHRIRVEICSPSYKEVVGRG